VHHAAEQRKRYYQDKFESFYRNNMLSVDVSKIQLSLDDEDVRYTTDPEPGLYDKIRCVEILRTLFRRTSKPLDGRARKEYVTILDPYSAPGMDVLYSLLLPFAFTDVSVFVTGVSLVKDVHDENRFKRMESNVRNMLDILNLKGSQQQAYLVRDNALSFCEKTKNNPPDILILSPPWLSSRGEMKSGVADIPRSPAELADEINRVRYQFQKPVKIISMMVPYDWDALAPYMPRIAHEYGVAETVRVIKKSNDDQRIVSSYFIHIVAYEYRGESNRKDLVYYM